MKKHYIKGRGAQINTPDPYSKWVRDEEDGLPDLENKDLGKTKYIEVYPKTIVNKVPSPDVGMEYSLNPYQGCEHGCIYCYARNTHPYWGYSAGLDFERIILIKKNAPELLIQFLKRKSWEGNPIMLSGNTDCFQPVEKKLGITRKLLEIFLDFKNPVGLITKNSLIRRDLDILTELSKMQLVRVVISLSTMNEKLRQKLEPRTASVKQRLETIRVLSENKIPTMVMIAPIIPGLNGHEIFDVVRAAAECGAKKAGYIVVRLNGDLQSLFIDWMEKNFPERKNKVLNQVAELHGGKLNDHRFSIRMKGEGKFAEMVAAQFHLAIRKYLTPADWPELNSDLFIKSKIKQLRLF